jgi:hypothetical protein
MTFAASLHERHRIAANHYMMTLCDRLETSISLATAPDNRMLGAPLVEGSVPQ